MTEARQRRAPILDGRLSAAMALAGNTRVFADIGADHGRLSAVLLRNGAEHALVADISAPALSKAQRRLGTLGLSNRATFCVADGLSALDAMPERVPDTVFILGMGGDTIGGILTRGAGKLCGATLVLGAQTELPLVRRALVNIGYRIRDEVIASEGRRDYLLLRATPAQPGEGNYTEREYLLGPMLLQSQSSAWKSVLEKRKRLLEKGVLAMRKAALAKDTQRLACFERELGYVNDCLRSLAHTEGSNA